jgi:hypothetical protein
MSVLELWPSRRGEGGLPLAQSKRPLRTDRRPMLILNAYTLRSLGTLLIGLMHSVAEPEDS